MDLMNLRKRRNLKAAGRYKFAVQSAKFMLIQTTHRCLAPHLLKRFMEGAELGNLFPACGRGRGGQSPPALEDSFPLWLCPCHTFLLPMLMATNRQSREMCLSVARRINKGSGFVFQEPRSSLKTISRLRNETPEFP